MNVTLVFAALAIALFVLAFISKRRFGLLGLALAAGYILSDIWSYKAGLTVNSLGIIPSESLSKAIALSVVVLLPAGVLLFCGRKYKNLVGRIFGAALFTLLALAFLVKPFGGALIIEGIGAGVYNQLADNRELIISVCIVVAMVDLFLTRPVQSVDKRRKH